MSSESKIELGPRRVVFVPPNARFPFYHLKVELRIDTLGELKFGKSFVNGSLIRDWSLWFEGIQERALGYANRSGLHDLILRYDWRCGENVQVTVQHAAGDRLLQAESTAPPHGGRAFAEMPHYFSIVARDVSGVGRRGYPIHTSVCLYSDQIVDPTCHLFVAQLSHDGNLDVIPHQVMDVRTWSDTALVEREPYRYQDSVTFELVAMADLGAGDEVVLLVFYGAKPPWSTRLEPTLTIRPVKELSAEIDNPFWTISTHEASGQIDEILLKSTGERMEHHAEPEGTIHWNPDVYAAPGLWSRCCEWDPPDGHVWQVGPHAARFQRWGTMPFGRTEVRVNISYWFYGTSGYILQESNIRITEPLAVKSLRNGEVVFNHALFNAFAWQERDGQIGQLRLEEARRHPEHGIRLDPCSRWMAFTNLQTGTSFSVIPLELSAFTVEHGAARMEAPYYYLAYGPWFYLSRALVYPFGSNNPQRMLMLSPGSSYYERNAFYPVRARTGDRRRYRQIEDLAAVLRQPPAIRMVMETDSRVPDKWVEPLVLKPFGELPPHLIFKPGESSI